MLEKIERNFALFAPAILLLAIAPAFVFAQYHQKYSILFYGYNALIVLASFLGTVAGLRMLFRGLKNKSLRSPTSHFLSVVLVSIPWIGTAWVYIFR